MREKAWGGEMGTASMHRNAYAARKLADRESFV